MKKIKYILFVLVLIKTICYAEEARTNEFLLNILHVNDTHSHIKSEKINIKVDNEEYKIDCGGYARYVTKINELKKNNTLLLNAGDVYSGTIYYTLLKGKADAKCLNMINWDAYEIGNHAFDSGDGKLEEFFILLNKNINILAANVIPGDNSPLKKFIKPYIIKTINKEKIGIIGVVASVNTKNSSSPSDEISFLNEISTIKKYIKELKEKKVEKIVLLTHLGIEKDKEIAKNIEGVDIIISGHSHTLMGNFSNIGLKNDYKKYPLIVESKNNKKVCIAQAWKHGHMLGNLNVKFDKNSNVLSCTGTPMLLVGNKIFSNRFFFMNEDTILAKVFKNKNIIFTNEDSKTLKLISTFDKKVEKEKKVKIAIIKEDIMHSRIPGFKEDGISLPFGSELLPLLDSFVYRYLKKSDAVVLNCGTVRESLYKGPLYKGDLYNILPFSTNLCEIKMSKKEIKQMLEEGVDYSMIGTGAFPYSYGLRYDINANNNFLNRVNNIKILNRRTNKFEFLEDNKTYNIIVSEYIASGKDGYKILGKFKKDKNKINNLGLNLLDLSAKYFKEGKYVKIPRDFLPIRSFVINKDFISK